MRPPCLTNSTTRAGSFDGTRAQGLQAGFHAQGRGRLRANTVHMWVAILTFAPVALVLGLLTFGRYGSRVAVVPTPARVAWVAAASALLGPVAVAVLGFFGWLSMVVVLATILAIVAVWRAPHTPSAAE